MREVGERRDRVHRRVEDQLRPLRRPQVGEGARPQARLDEQRLDLLRVLERRRAGERPEPRLGVELVLDVRVGVADAAHERDGRDQRPLAVRRTISSAPSPFWIVITVADGTRPGEPSGRVVDVGRLRRQDDEVGVGQRRLVRGRVERAR